MAKARLSFAAAAAALLVCTGAAAQTFTDQVTTTQAQIQLLQTQKQLNDLLAADPVLTKMPKVVSVMSFGTEVKAKLMLASGVALTYAEGENINQRMRVVAITPRDVVVAITPTDTSRAAKGKKSPAPVLMPLEFMAGAQQNSQQAAFGMPGAPGTPVTSGPIPPGLMQAPPVIQGGSLANWPDRSSMQSVPSAVAPVAASPVVVAPPVQN